MAKFFTSNVALVVVLVLFVALLFPWFKDLNAVKDPLSNADAANKWTSAVASVFQVIAILFAGAVFQEKLAQGYQIDNLAVSIDCERVKGSDNQPDFLGVCVHLSKGSRGTLQLHIADITIDYHGNPSPGPHKLGCIERTRAKWNAKNLLRDPMGGSPEKYPWLNLAPHDKIHIGYHERIPSGVPCLIEVMIVGVTQDEGSRCQWKASRACLPIPLGRVSAASSPPPDEAADSDTGGINLNSLI